jgi:hypothetical protein
MNGLLGSGAWPPFPGKVPFAPETQSCSPILAISISLAQLEHLIVGKKLEDLPVAAKGVTSDMTSYGMQSRAVK